MKRVIVNHKYTYETDIEDLKIGDHVMLPTANWIDSGSTWKGYVTALESDYDGPCVKILGKYPEIID